MRVVSTTGASHLTRDGVEFDADESGVFDVPEHVGRDLIAFPDWLEEHVALAQSMAEQAARDAAPANVVERMNRLEQRIADLEARLADNDADQADEVEKPKRGRKTTDSE